MQNAAAAAAGTSSEDSTATSAQQDLKSFDTEFIKQDHPTLFEIILAANYLDIKELLDLSCQKVADIITPYTRRSRSALCSTSTTTSLRRRPRSESRTSRHSSRRHS
jgi:hypothetical protein